MKLFSTILSVLGLALLPQMALAAPLPSAPIDRATAMGFAPHRAIYDVRLSKTHSGSQVVNIQGQMMYEWQPTCDAWLSNHHFNISYEYVDSAPMKIVSDFSTYETFDGKSFSFLSQRKRDGELFEEIRGQGVMNPPKGGKALYTMPEPQEYVLPDGALFPMGHSIEILNNVRAGKKFYNATTFDGSDPEGPIEVNTFIGKSVTPMAGFQNTKSIDKTLISSPARRVRMAFFPLKQRDTSPDGDFPADLEGVSDYEMGIVLHDNGVISDMSVEYKDFSLSQKLVALEPVKDGCGDGKPRLNP